MISPCLDCADATHSLYDSNKTCCTHPLATIGKMVPVSMGLEFLGKSTNFPYNFDSSIVVKCNKQTKKGGEAGQLAIA